MMVNPIHNCMMAASSLSEESDFNLVSIITHFRHTYTNIFSVGPVFLFEITSYL